MSDTNDTLAGIADQLGIIQDTLAVLLRQQFATGRIANLTLIRLTGIETQETQQVATFHDLQQQVTKSDDVMDGAIILLSNISQMLQDAKNANGGDPAATSAAIDKVISDLGSRTEALAQALVKNTPVDPNPTSPATNTAGQGTTTPTTGQMNQPVPTGPAPGGTDTPVDPNTAGAATPQDVNPDVQPAATSPDPAPGDNPAPAPADTTTATAPSDTSTAANLRNR